MPIPRPSIAHERSQIPLRLAAAWAVLAVAMIVWLALRPRGELLWTREPVDLCAYMAIVAGLTLSTSAAWLFAWVRTRRRPAAIMALLTTLFAVAVGADGWLSRSHDIAFERVVAEDWRYRIYVHGWLRDTNYRDNIFLHKKTDSSPGPYTAGFRCKMLDSDFIIGPLGFRRHSTRSIDPNSPIVMCTGGSVTFGMTVNPADKPFPDMLEDTLVTRNPLLASVRVVNAAVPGMDVTKCGQLVQTCKVLSPAAIVFYESINYMPSPLPKRITPRNSGIASWLDRVYVRAESILAVQLYSGKRYKKELLKFIDTCRSISAEPVLVTFAMPFTSDADKETLAYFDVMQNGQGSAYAAARLVEIHNRMIQEAALESGVLCVDAARELTGHEELFVDSCHFTQEGCHRLAELIAPAVAVTLKDKAPQELASAE